jgi:signal transduction histidine kinase
MTASHPPGGTDPTRPQAGPPAGGAAGEPSATARCAALESDVQSGELTFIGDTAPFLGNDPAPATMDELMRRIHPLDTPGLRAAIDEAIAHRVAIETEYRLRRSDGSYHVIHEYSTVLRDRSGQPTRRVAVMCDRGETPRGARASAMHLEALGELATGVAHDVNSMMFVITTHVESAEKLAASDARLSEELSVIRRACAKATALTRRVLTLARDVESARRRTDLNHLIDDVLRLLRRVMPAGISIQFRPESGLEPVLVDPVQIEQVITNLCTNARDAMPAGGAITIETTRVGAGDPIRAAMLELGDAPWLRLSIRDTGAGMSEELQRRAFEPTLGDKELGAGTGTGLRLTISHRIVRRHGGILALDSRPGAGTAVHVFLPLESQATR